MKCKVCKKNEVYVYAPTKCWDCFAKDYNKPKKWKGGV